MLNGLTMLSLVLFAAAVAFWVRSHVTRDRISYGLGFNRPVAEFDVYEGGVWVWVTRKVPPSGSSTAEYWANHHDALRRSGIRFFGIRYLQIGGEHIGRLPFWTLAGLAGVLPLTRVIRRLGRGRGARAGLCPSCGYDLRATPERCPECGAVPEPKATAS